MHQRTSHPPDGSATSLIHSGAASDQALGFVAVEAPSAASKGLDGPSMGLLDMACAQCWAVAQISACGGLRWAGWTARSRS